MSNHSTLYNIFRTIASFTPELCPIQCTFPYFIQGCVLSSIISAACIQDALDKFREDMETGVKIQRETINMIRSAADIVIVAESEQDLSGITGKILFLQTMEK